MNEVLIRNLCNAPRDYPLKNGENIYLASKGHSSSVTKISKENISEALNYAEKKRLISIEELQEAFE